MTDATCTLPPSAKDTKKGYQSNTMNMSNVLAQILETKRAEIAALLAQTGRDELQARCADCPPTRGFRAGLVGGGSSIRLIAEVKKASPSRGIIREDFDPVEIARAYHEGGASCLSVLTDKTYFQGDLSYLTAVREAVPLPVMRKDFILDAAQIYEARLAGADAILLIVAAIPDPARLADLRHIARSVGMDALVEIHDRKELGLAIESGATMIGINNRDLRTFETSLDTTINLLPNFPATALAISESGIANAADADRLRRAGANAILVGESLMRSPDIAAAVRSLMVG